MAFDDSEDDLSQLVTPLNSTRQSVKVRSIGNKKFYSHSTLFMTSSLPLESGEYDERNCVHKSTGET